MIVWTVEDYLKECGYGTVTDHSYEVTHSPEESTKTDTVHIALEATCERASLSTTYDATYQYNKASDLWTVIRGGEWQSASIASYRLDYSPKPLLSVMLKRDRRAEIETEPIYIWDSIPEQNRSIIGVLIQTTAQYITLRQLTQTARMGFFLEYALRS